MSEMFFNEIEAARIAQTMEQNGLAFYECAAAKSKSPRVRDLFLKLAEDEKTHLVTFQELEQALASRRTAPPPSEDEVGEYITKLLKTQVFGDSGDVARLSDQTADDYEALAVGMRAERDSIAFYQEMIDFVDSKEAREAFARILKEERRHLETLGQHSEDCANFTP